jgi:CheY-like chemotaxis protein
MQVLSARDGEAAARSLASCSVDILVTELIMPVMDGFELLSYVLEEHRGIEIVVMGETELGRTSQALCAGGAFRFLSKPVAVEDLIDVVRDILAGAENGRLARRGPSPRPAAPEVLSSGGEEDSENAAQEPGPGKVLGSFSTFAVAALRVELTTAARGLGAFMQLEGTLGAGILDFETGRSLAHVCRGRDRYFAEMATQAARAVREGMHLIGDPNLQGSVSQLKLYGPKQFQLVRVVRSHPDLLLFFAGLVGRADVDAASDLLGEFEDMIIEARG